jgi:serine/threonine-protein kinase
VKRERWERINAILDLALEADPHQRDAIVAAECAGDAELASEVARFLAASGDATSLFENPPLELINSAFAATATDGDELKPGDMVGAYRVVEKIGSGGMGAVYHAERADGEFEKRVALKVIRRGQDTDDVVSRFHDERRILARLQHPNIAALLDGGMTAVGPYFVMEYAPGEPIDRYLARAAAGLEERIRLFLTVCEAVHYAHQNLVVHRDLKPSNVLVSNGEPKLLDFGIAKVLDPETGAGVVATHITEIRLTPQYAAPEQVLGQPVTTATDVYALGMILYELIAGKPPYDVKALSMVEVARVVCRVDPAAPSTTVRTGGAKVQPTMPEITWRIPKDLDAIVLMALEKSPARRYASVAAFADDLRRFLDGLPVRARPDTLLYRGSKFVRRNAAMVSLGTAAFLALSIGIVTTSWQARRAAVERDRSEQEARNAAGSRDFLLGMLGELDVDRLGGQPIRPADLIAFGLRNLDELPPDPQLRAPVMNTLAQVSFNLGERVRADSLYREAYALLEPFTPHPDQAVSLMGTGLVRQRDLRHEEAIEAYRRALAVRREVLPANDAAIAESMTSLAFALYTLGASVDGPRADSLLTEAETLYLSALTSLTDSTDLRARALEGLGDIEQERARNPRTAEDSASADALLANAEAHYREAIHTGVSASKDTTPANARRMWGLAAISNARGNPDAAVEVCRQALAALERTYGESHPDVALAHYYLAAYLERAGRHADAADSYERSSQIYVAILDHRSPYTGPALMRAGRARLHASQPALALPSLRSALQLWNREIGQPQIAPDRLTSLRQSVAETSTLLAEVFDLLQQPDSASFYRARARAHSSP